MTHYDISYAKLSPAEADAKAIKDIQAYLGAKGWLNLMELTAKETTTCRTLDFALSIIGVRGFPVFAFMRTYRPTSFDAWYNDLPEV